MATTLTKQNLANIFDRVEEIYDTLKSEQDSLYSSFRSYNIDLSSHFFFRGNSDVEYPLMLALQNYREYIKTVSTEYSCLSRYVEFKRMFNAFNTYFLTESELTDKTINGFLAYNDLKVSDKVNKIYHGITGNYLQSRNVLPPENMIFASAIPVIPSVGADPIWQISLPETSVINNTSYVSTSVTGNTYTPFPIKIVPSSEITGVVFVLTWSDDSQTSFDFSSTPLTTAGYCVPVYHSGIKSISLVSGSIGTTSLTFYTNFTYIKFLSPLGWCNPGEEAIQAYITDINGTRLFFGNAQFVPKSVEFQLYLRIKPSLLGDENGTFFINDTQQDLGTVDGEGWFVNTVQVTPTTNIIVQAKSISIAPIQEGPVSYVFSGIIDGDMDKIGNYSPSGIPTSVDSVDFTGKTITTGSLICDSAVFSGTTINGGSFTITQGLTLTNGSQTGDSAVLGTVTFVDSINYGTVTTAIFQSDAAQSYNFGTCVSAVFNDGTFNGTTEDQTATCENASFYNGINYSTVSATARFYYSSQNADSGTCHHGIFQETSSNTGTCDIASFYPGGGSGSWTYPQNTGTCTTAQCFWLQADNDLGGTVTNEYYWGYLDNPNPSTDFVYTDNGSDITITGFNYSLGKEFVIIPSTINSKPVIAIAENVFGNTDDIVSVYIPDSITSIGTACFTGEDTLKNIRFSSGISHIPDATCYLSFPTACFFEGNAPTIGTADVFGTATPTLYYRLGTTGWTNPWNGFTTIGY
ncbi:MAG: leucine-rich repeat domain-containing protein [Candidatus Omnitrophica bacterium]|nr:leucine-rich repeat domain-containing protein [Candidatus Omnitrophota bacterium]